MPVPASSSHSREDPSRRRTGGDGTWTHNAGSTPHEPSLVGTDSRSTRWTYHSDATDRPARVSASRLGWSCRPQTTTICTTPRAAKPSRVATSSTSRRYGASVVEGVVHELLEVLEPGALVEGDCSATGMNLDSTAPCLACENQQHPKDLRANSTAAMRRRDIHRLDVPMMTIQFTGTRDPVDHGEEAHADGPGLVPGDNRSEPPVLPGPPPGEAPFEGSQVAVLVAVSFDVPLPAKRREGLLVGGGGFPNLEGHGAQTAGPAAENGVTHVGAVIRIGGKRPRRPGCRA